MGGEEGTYGALPLGAQATKPSGWPGCLFGALGWFPGCPGRYVFIGIPCISCHFGSAGMDSGLARMNPRSARMDSGLARMDSRFCTGQGIHPTGVGLHPGFHFERMDVRSGAHPWHACPSWFKARASYAGLHPRSHLRGTSGMDPSQKSSQMHSWDGPIPEVPLG